MSLTAFGLIFLSVFLHVTWNFLSKKTNPSLAFYLLMSCTASVIWLPFFLLSDFPARLGELPPLFWGLLGCSVVAEVAYMGGLAYAYRRSDISLVYPLVRALPVLLVALATLLLGLGKTPAPVALAGMVLITSGCIFMPLKHFADFRLSRFANGVIGFILLGAVGTTGYTLADSQAIGMLRELQFHGVADTLGLLYLIETGLALGMAVLVVLLPEERRAFGELFGRTPLPFLAGLCSSGAYALILFSMRFVSNVSYVQAFRQMSLPLGFLAGVVLLHEKSAVPKAVGLLLIVIGLLMVSLG